MKRVLSIVLLLVLFLGLGILVKDRMDLLSPGSAAEPRQTVPAQSSAVPAASETAEAPAAPTAEERDFVFSLVGDCTLASPQFIGPTEGRSIEHHIQDDYAYPFANTKEFFENDDWTLANLECVLSDVRLSSIEQFSFRAPSAYAEILNEGGVDFVTTANNHLEDFGTAGAEFTYMALDEHGIPYGKDGECKLIPLDGDLTLGVYCATGTYNGGFLEIDSDAAVAAVRQLRADGADYVICALHWGKELVYSPRDDQVDIAHRCIDAGADLIYGAHSHCLQPIEEYNGGLILYSVGNWVFGGSTAPSDQDTALFQIHVKRESDGSIHNDGCTAIPCCVSGRPVKDGYTGDNYNDYQPTLYEEGSEDYNRVLAKLDGSFVPDSEGRDYSDVYAQYG